MTRSLPSYATPFQTSNSLYYLILFLIWPFLSFILALINYSEKEAKKVVYIFLIYYGLTFFVDIESFMDSARYAMQLEANARLPFSDFFKIVGGMYSNDSSVDIIEPMISFVLSRFTKDYRILFGVYAAIFGYFYLHSINLLHGRYRQNPGWDTSIHMIFFIFILPITAINGFRMWTATWIFFYAAYHVVMFRDGRFFVLAFLASLVHWSFLSVNVLLVVYYFAGNRNLFYIPIAISSFIIPQLLAPLFQSISLLLGGGIESRYNMYSAEDVILGRQQAMEEVAWFITLSSNMVFNYLVLSIIVVQLKTRKLVKDKSEKNLFSFLLLILAFVNFGRGIPSFGSRFQVLFFLFGTLYIFLYFLKLPRDRINLLTLVGLFPMALYSAVAFRQGCDSINVWLLTPGLGSPWFVPGKALAEVLFG